MPNEQLLGELLCTVCDLCHWPYVYQDKDVMYAEKCSYCPAINILERLKRSLQSPAVALTNENIQAAVKKGIESSFEEMRRTP